MESGGERLTVATCVAMDVSHELVHGRGCKIYRTKSFKFGRSLHEGNSRARSTCGPSQTHRKIGYFTNPLKYIRLLRLSEEEPSFYLDGTSGRANLQTPCMPEIDARSSSRAAREARCGTRLELHQYATLHRHGGINLCLRGY